MNGPQEDPLGTVLRGDGRLGVRFVRHFRHPPEKVWRALTEAQHLRHWLPCDIQGERRAGAELTLPFWPDHTTKDASEEAPLKGVLKTWEPPRVFEWTWDTDLLRFELEPTGGGTTLTFTTWLATEDGPSAARTAAGYHVCFMHLQRTLEGDTAQRLVDSPNEPWKTLYGAAVTAALQR